MHLSPPDTSHPDTSHPLEEVSEVEVDEEATAAAAGEWAKRTEDDIGSWSVRQLKTFLAGRGVDVCRYSEKSELIAEVRRRGGGKQAGLAPTDSAPPTAASISAPTASISAPKAPTPPSSTAESPTTSPTASALGDTKPSPTASSSSSSTTMSHAAPGVWQVKLAGTFTPYADAEVQRKLEVAYLAGDAEVEVTIHGIAYAVGLRGERMLQINKLNPAGRCRHVRRAVPLLGPE